MNERQYSSQELLEMAYRHGAYNREKKESEPLLCVCQMKQYYVPYGSEAFFRQVVEWYEAGYKGLTLVPTATQWQ